METDQKERAAASARGRMAPRSKDGATPLWKMKKTVVDERESGWSGMDIQSPQNLPAGHQDTVKSENNVNL